jgi:hypothetical protein
VFRTVSDQPTLWDAILPSELLVLPSELARVDVLLDDPVFFAPFAAYFDARIGRPSIPMETYLRLMFLKFRYRLGYELLCREVADSISGSDFADAWMWTSDFTGLLAMVGRRSGLDVRGPASGEPTRCVLYPNASKLFSYSGFGMFNNLGTLRQLQANPPQPGLAMDVGKDAICVIDLNRNALIVSAWLAQVTATPAENRTYVYRAGTWTTPVLVVRVAGLQPLTIGCPESPDPAWPRVSYSAVGVKRNVSRFSWRGQVYQESQPDYLVSGADWLTLVEKLGLASYLEDTANRVRG